MSVLSDTLYFPYQSYQFYLKLLKKYQPTHTYIGFL